MDIVINNKKDLEKFYRLLPFYRTIIFKYTKFKIKKSKYNITPIIKALNIKKRRKRITYIYNKSCNTVDDYYKGLNICNFINNQCIAQRLDKSNNINGCCGFCRYHNNKGCTTKNLACKLFVCSTIRRKHKDIKFNDIEIIKLLSIRQKVLLRHNYFSKEEDIINDLYIGSILIGTIRILIRLIISIIYSKRRRNYEEKQ